MHIRSAPDIILLLCQKKHDLIAACNKIRHLLCRKRLIGKHCQIIKLLSEHIDTLSLCMLKDILDQSVVGI